MTRGKVRRLGAAGVVLGCLIALPSPAGAADPPALSINDVPVVEGTGAAPTAMVFTVTRTGDLSAASKVTASTPSSSSDFAPKSQELNFAADDGTETFTVNVVADALDEPNETFQVTLSSPTNATLTDSTGTGTITDDDPEVSVGTVSDATVVEGNAGTVDASITVTLSAPSGKTVTVPYATAPLSATEGTDYEQKADNFTFVPGDVSETVVFRVKGDTSRSRRRSSPSFSRHRPTRRRDPTCAAR